MAGNPDAAALETIFTAIEVDLATALEQDNMAPQFHMDAYGRAFELRQEAERQARERSAAGWPPGPDVEMDTLARLYQSLMKAFTRRAER
ncbi:hypothetical protein AAVH_29708, partial [Aphelenchoides avenae]